MRKLWVCIAVLLLAAGCGPGYDNSAPVQKSADKQSDQLFSYEHSLDLAMPRASVPAHFNAARDACLNDEKFKCTLVSANLSLADADGRTTAELEVAVPHELVDAYVKKLQERLPEDGSGKVTITARSTKAENVTAQSQDLDRKIAQLTSYRDSLANLAKRENATVDDLIKINNQLSQIQGDLDDAVAQKQHTGFRIAKENIHVTMSEETAVAGPVMKVWRHAGEDLAASFAIMLQILVVFTPWILAGGAIALIVLAIRRLFVKGKKSGAPAA